VNSDITQYVEIRTSDARFFRLLEVLGEFYEQGKIIVFVHSQVRFCTAASLHTCRHVIMAQAARYLEYA
jgi:ATP-dependent RNA helicase DDX46/PRP5